MTFNGWLQIAVYCAIVIAITVPLGGYMTRVFVGERTLLSPALRPVETILYRLSGVEEHREQNWIAYAVSVLLFSFVGFLVLYILPSGQGGISLFNPQDVAGVAPD